MSIKKGERGLKMVLSPNPNPKGLKKSVQAINTKANVVKSIS